MTFLTSHLLSDNEKLLRATKPIPYNEQEYFLGSAFLVNLTASNKNLLA